jgi:hypothetical protein
MKGKLKGKRTFGRPRHRWEDNIKWIFKKLDGNVDWINLAQDRDRHHDRMRAVM